MKKTFFYFDTNVLFGLYQYTNFVTEAIIKVLNNEYDNLIVIPERAVFEYFKNRDSIIKKAKIVNVITSTKKELGNAYNSLSETIEAMLKLKIIESFNTSSKYSF